MEIENGFSEYIGDLDAAEAAIHDAIRNVESIARYKTSFSDEHLRKMLFHVRLLMKMLTEAHQLRATSSTVTKTTTPHFAKDATSTTTMKVGDNPVVRPTVGNDRSSQEASRSTLSSNVTKEAFLFTELTETTTFKTIANTTKHSSIPKPLNLLPKHKLMMVMERTLQITSTLRMPLVLLVWSFPGIQMIPWK
ncbi:hypothetical protein KIN20_011693 [Parelaphostrongylus tenuis]|uniref:Uncharacterized protein n=1 Tax=Parelaphostrongylus tenuis TaxID=148309 RepID=A0AAD5M9U2_PARTN|nr:hypothetical protein KIN20_011693 [Parelaphostrongylus tenuis]